MTLVLSPAAGIAHAQSTLEEVIVTARKREESLQEVPIAVSVATGEQLQRQGVRDLNSLARMVPNLYARPSTGSASMVAFVIRGQGTGDTLTTTDQAVGIYLDGAYIARVRGLNASFFDMERIEVLKGPQGTLYGRNTTGGALNLITRGADHNGLHGYVGGDLGNHKARSARVAVNVPLVKDVAAVRLAYQRTLRQGFGQSRITGQHLGHDRNQHLFRGSLRFDPADNFSAVFKVEHYRSRENGLLNVPLAISDFGVTPANGLQPSAVTEAAVELFGCFPSELPATTLAPPGVARRTTPGRLAAARAYLNGVVNEWRTSPYTNSADVRQVDDNTITTYSGTVAWDLAENVQLKSITAYRQFYTDQQFDLDGTQFILLHVGVGAGGNIPTSDGRPGSQSPNFTIPLTHETKNSFFSQEFNLSGQAFDDRLNWLGGVYYSNESGLDNQQSLVRPVSVRSISLNYGEKIINRSWSIYSQNDLKLTDAVSITLGGRYTEERKGLQSLNANFNPLNGLYTCGTTVPAPPPTANLTNCRVRDERTFSGYSYLASINWKVTQDALVYVRTAKGFRGGAFQLRFPVLPPAGPETAKDIEVGLKADWLAGRLRTNVAAFRTKYINKQESIIVVDSSGTLRTVIQNAANATLKGLEADIAVAPIEGLTITAAASYIHGKYDRFPTALSVTSQPWNPPNGATGERFALPPYQYSVSGRYELPAGPGEIGLQASWIYQYGARPPARLINPGLAARSADLLANIGASPSSGGFAQGNAGLGLLNLRIDYDIEDWGLNVALWANNALDEKYYIGSIDPGSNGGVFTGSPIEPRMWGATVKKTFGNE